MTCPTIFEPIGEKYHERFDGSVERPVGDRHKFHFDTVQMPVNIMDDHYRSFTNEVLPELAKRNIGAPGIKSLGGSAF